MSETNKPWAEPMPERQFTLMRRILDAPSPVGLEGAMTYGVLKPHFESFAPRDWHMRQYKGHAGVVWDTHPGRDDLFKVMIIGHADKIRMQVRSIGDDGKIWINTDAFLPNVLVGHEVKLFSEDPEAPGSYRIIQGGTVEALGAIHFSDAAQREGSKGIKKEQIYLDLQIHGENKKQQVLNLGVRPGDSIIFDRPIRHGFSPNTFYGAYLDNGLGCFVTAEVARLIAEAGGTEKVRLLFAIASYEEIGRFGSRVLAGELRPDVVIGVDVNHDYVAAPGIGERRMQPLEMGKGFTMSVGAIASEQLNRIIETTAREHGIPMQRDIVGADTGTDGMAGVLAAVDCAATSIGFPIRNMHTISETGNTQDVLAAIHVLTRTLQALDALPDPHREFLDNHPRLDQAERLTHQGSAKPEEHRGETGHRQKHPS
ncbi:M20/M25/M40 family metallo-hydrolase [Billgrantia tianxiuensis]|jgi:putative aminopeptidase FrvX|uniref:M20/M25/M40 family metallo-hydrolase n=1 Tax=Billgrantia tianxiuensis TaxID=2497861 RepID=A0A6I6SUC6_9GAMM|nr:MULTISPECIES: M20/M25/M40 family metallo-hydrolase [Halomonas]MCE8033747.1 M20/M25/M40 family metallo-hydrolase [Halomonas sp. MCCC 1A11057]QHC51320.1 M20/M25/M40 family metallo-hydrolase [Halomonas tianxiuensis]